jgi:type II secretory pathway pseudopilin PulG
MNVYFKLKQNKKSGLSGSASNRKSSNASGFTLIEMMVSTALFIIVALVITGALMMVIQSYRKVQSAKLAMDNLSFVMDNMILRLRDGSDYQEVNSQNGYSQGISFIGVDGVRIKFKEVNSAGRGSIQKCSDSDSCVTLTAPEVNITDLRFYIRQNDSVNKRPLVIIFIRGVAGKKGDSQVEFALQTTVSQRNARPTIQQ